MASQRQPQREIRGANGAGLMAKRYADNSCQRAAGLAALTTEQHQIEGMSCLGDLIITESFFSGYDNRKKFPERNRKTSQRRSHE
jgi:hypothetical protein